MGKKWVKPHKHKVDKIFYKPVGSEEVFTTTGGSEEFLTALIESNAQSADGLIVVDAPPVGVLETPNLFSIIDQRIVHGVGGETFVDIVVDVEDINGATEYQVSIAQIGVAP